MNSRSVAVTAIVGVVVLTLLVFGLRTYVSYKGSRNYLAVSERAESAEAAYRAAGMPWVADDMNPHPPVTASENAAPIFEEAMAAMKDFPYAISGRISETARAGDEKEANRLLKPYTAALLLASEAAKKPRLDFHRDWDLNAALRFPEFIFFKNFDRLLVARAQVEAHTGNDAACLADLETAESLNRLLCTEPTMIAMLTQISCEAIADKGIENCAYLMRARSDSLIKLERLMEHPPVANFANAMRGEAYIGVAVFRNLDHTEIGQLSGTEPAKPSKLPRKPLVRSGLPKGNIERAWATVHLELYTKIARVLTESPTDLNRISEEMDRLNEELERDKSVSSLLELIIFPVYSQAATLIFKEEAIQRTVKALVAAVEIKARTGKYPARLSDIPGEWIDPFTNKPLKYKLTAAGVRVYSVGPTLVDHGGIAQSEVSPKGSKAYDIVASCPPVAPRR